MFSVARNWAFLLVLVTTAAFADSVAWTPAKVIAVEKTTTPDKTPGPECRNLPRGSTPPAACRPAHLQGEIFWKVTLETGTRRYVVKPYRAPKFIETLNQERPLYVDPNLTTGQRVEIAVYPKSLRIRTDAGEGMPATLDEERSTASQDPVRVEAAATLQVQAPITVREPGAPAAPGDTSRVVLLENGDFADLEIQQVPPQDIGDGAGLYSFSGVASPVRIGTRPVFMALGGQDAANLELSRLQAGKATRQLVYSLAKKRSASAIGITVNPVSDSVQKITVNDPLPPGEYVLLERDSNRAFLFAVK